MHEQLQAIITVLSLINPAICAAMFAAMFARAVSGKSLSGKMTDAARAAGAILIILTLAALLGMQLLHLFGVSLDAFMVAGGGVLAWMGFSMLSGQPAAVDAKSTPSLTPLILFAASPGTFPNLVISRPEVANSLNIYNGADVARRHCSDTGRRPETQHPRPLGRRHRLLERQRLQLGKE